MKRILNRVMAKLGYVPVAASIHSLKIDIDSTQVDAALAKLKRLNRAAHRAKATASAIPSAVAMQFATAELAPLPGQVELIAEVRNLICEIRADREAVRHMRREGPLTGGCTGAGAGARANNSGLPG